MTVKTDDIVKRLYGIVPKRDLFWAAAGMIERQAKALEESETFLEANCERMHHRGVVPFSRTKAVIESIRTARGEKEDD